MKLNLLSLQDGEDFITSNGIVFRHPTVSDVKAIGENLYLWWMFSWLYTPSDLMHQLWISGIDYEKITKDELFLMSIKSDFQLFVFLLKYFTDIVGAELTYNEEYEMELIYFNTKEDLELRCLYPNVMDEISYFIKTIHYYKNSIPRSFATYEDKKKILDYEIEELNFYSRKKEEFELGYISSMKQALVVYNARTWEYVSSLYIYQLVSEMSGINKLEESRRLYQGIYAGTIDYSKLDKKLLNWIN